MTATTAVLDPTPAQIEEKERRIAFWSDVIASNLLPFGELHILQLGSGQGALGEELIQILGQGRLTIVDIHQPRLDLNTNPKTTKVRANVLDLNLGCEFDIVLMHNLLDFFIHDNDQVSVLRTAWNHLKHAGMFVHQPLFIPDDSARIAISEAHCLSGFLANRRFQSCDLGKLYERAGFTPPLQVGQGEDLVVTDKDHIRMFKASPSHIRQFRAHVSNAAPYAELTEDGYRLRFKLPIFVNGVKKDC